MQKSSVVFVTVDKPKNANKICNILLKEHLAACVNRVRNLSSSYWWKGKIEKATEILLIIKTRRSNIQKLITRVKQLHPYSVPEVISFDIKKGNKEYMDWLVHESMPVRKNKKKKQSRGVARNASTGIKRKNPPSSRLRGTRKK